jgi:DNA-binding beta-propeller fold protein YncE
MKQVQSTARRALMVAIAAIGLAGPAEAAAPKPIASGLHGAIGTALDEANTRLYFVEYNTGQLKYLELTPTCVSPALPAMCTIHPVASGFSHPEDVALDVDAGVAYVTTRDLPGTGGLYRVNLTTGAKTLVAFNLGAPQQLALRARAGKAYTVGYDDGRLHQIDLATGVKKALATGLDHPVGIVVTDDDSLAYVTEQGAKNAITRIILSTGAKSSVVGGLTAPFFLAWTDAAHASVYLVERDPANRVSRVDVATGGKTATFTGLPFRPSAVAVGSAGAALFITTDAEIVLGSLGLDPTVHPDFMGIGLISVSEIDATGRANTIDGYYKDAPFGGTLSIFANLTHFKRDLHAGFYRLTVSKNGGAAQAITLPWSTQKWDPTPPNPAYKPYPVSVVSGTEMYEIPNEYATGDAAWWYPPYLIVKYPTAENGTYDFTLTIHATSAGPALGTFTKRVLVDNTPPTVNIHNIYQCSGGVCTQEVLPCDIVTTGNQFAFKISAWDPEGHLLNYGLYGMYGNNCEIGVTSDTYESHVATSHPSWNGVSMMTTSPKALPCNCAYTMYLYAWGRTTNGYGYLQYVDYHKSFTLNQPTLSHCSATSCP